MATITVRLTPRGGRDGIEGLDGDILRVRVSAPPADGAANDALVRLVARALRVPRSNIELVTGTHSRTKTLRVTGLDEPELRARLAGTAGRA